ncbi:MAG: Gfo/Idh/MocA family oxidoreductase [Deltaproteobacteria bacterium]|nr:Gfo/Idh/MocA family oxidoreductase [Deltaproteobacteria bacterium]
MKHGGAYSPWFFTVEEAGGGILMDMGCHAIELCRWMLGKPQVVSVYADVDRFVHNAQPLDDHVMMIVEFEGRKKALVESSWTRVAGWSFRAKCMAPRALSTPKCIRREWVCRPTPRTVGRSLRKVGARRHGKASSSTAIRPRWPISSARSAPGEPPLETGEDGLAVLEIMIAGYQSAATGRRIDFPFDDPGGYRSPVELWLRAEAAR